MTNLDKYAMKPICDRVKLYITESLESEFKQISNTCQVNDDLLANAKAQLETMFMLPKTRKELRIKVAYLKQMDEDLKVIRTVLQECINSLNKELVDPRTLSVLKQSALLTTSYRKQLKQGWYNNWPRTSKQEGYDLSTIGE